MQSRKNSIHNYLLKELSSLALLGATNMARYLRTHRWRSLLLEGCTHRSATFLPGSSDVPLPVRRDLPVASSAQGRDSTRVFYDYVLLTCQIHEAVVVTVVLHTPWLCLLRIAFPFLLVYTYYGDHLSPQ